MKPSFEIGDRVRFNRQFLQSTCTYTGAGTLQELAVESDAVADLKGGLH